MRLLIMREPLPDRRRSWRQEVIIGGQTIFLNVGEYTDGRPGEIFVDVSKEGTFLKGVMGTLARMISLSLQCGAGVDVICHALRGIDYPPHGQVIGSDTVTECCSVTDWIASELEVRYLYQEPVQAQTDTSVGEGDVKIPEKSCGHIPESWRTGA